MPFQELSPNVDWLYFCDGEWRTYGDIVEAADRRNRSESGRRLQWRRAGRYERAVRSRTKVHCIVWLEETSAPVFVVDSEKPIETDFSKGRVVWERKKSNDGR